MQSFLSQFSSFGFSGSRSVVPACLVSVIASVPRGSLICVGCAGGVDAAVRSITHSGPFIGSTRIFQVADFPARSFAASLALRSSACVRAVGAVGGCWVSFPSSPCPLGLVPCASPFSGSGSGSWASLALAVWLRVPCLVFLPCGVSIPSSWRVCLVGCLGASPCGGRFVSLCPPPVLSLF